MPRSTGCNLCLSSVLEFVHALVNLLVLEWDDCSTAEGVFGLEDSFTRLEGDLVRIAGGLEGGKGDEGAS